MKKDYKNEFRSYLTAKGYKIISVKETRWGQEAILPENTPPSLADFTEAKRVFGNNRYWVRLSVFDYDNELITDKLFAK